MPKHGELQVVLGMQFETYGQPQQILSAFTETRVTWPAEGISYVPDVIAYRIERVPYDVEDQIVERLLTPPDVAVEIRSPGQGLDEQRDRCRWYVEHGVAVALLAHP